MKEGKDLALLHSEAVYHVVLASLKLLHERELLSLHDVCDRLDSRHYSLVAGHDFAANPVLQALTDQLRQIANAYPKP